MKLFLLILRFTISMVLLPILIILFPFDCLAISMFGAFAILSVFLIIAEIAQWLFSMVCYDNKHDFDWGVFVVFVAPFLLIYIRWKSFVFDEKLILYPVEEDEVEFRIDWSRYKTVKQ